MLRTTFLQALADLRSRPLQTFLVFFVIAAAATVLMLALTVWRASSEPYERALERANGPHAWFFGGRADLLEIAVRDGVADSAGPYTVGFNYSVNVGSDRHPVRFWATGAELPAVAPALLIEGRWLSPDGEGEVVIGSGFAREAGFEVGDEIVVADEAGRTALDIVGIAANFERAPYPVMGPAVFHVLPDTFVELVRGRVNGWMLGVRLEDPGASERFVRQARADFPDPFVQTSQDIGAIVDEVNHGNVIFLMVFAVFALLAVGFIIANTIGGQVLARFREIGLLKAVGFTPGGVTALLMIENMVIAIPGAMVGAAVGFALSPLFLSNVAALFNESAFPAFNPGVLVTVVGGATVITMVFTALPAWQAGRVSTLRALTGGAMAEGSRPSLPARIATWLRLPPLLVIAVKDAFSRPLRAAFTIAALTLAVITVTFAVAVDATLVGVREDPGLLGGDPFELHVAPRTMSDDDTEALVAARPEVTHYVKRSWFEVEIPGRYQSIGIWGLAGDYEDIGYRVLEGRMFSGPGEAVLGLGLARSLDLGPGDKIGFLLKGRKMELPVVGTYTEENNGGRRFMFDAETFTGTVGEAWFVDFGLKLAPDADAETVRQALLRDGGGAIDVDNFEQAWAESADELRREFRTILFSLNGVLLAVAAVNLLATLLFTVRERQRDVGILKSIGLTPAQVVGSFVLGSTVLAMIAAAIGIPVGTYLTALLFDFAGDAEGWPKGIGEAPDAVWVPVIVLLAVAVAVLGSALPALQAGRSRIIDALRYE